VNKEQKAAFHAAIVSTIAAWGSLVSPRASEYGWHGEDTGEREHVRECGANPAASTWQDSEWTEFSGTFAEPPFQYRKGIDATVTCNCGLVEGERFRYTDGYAELIRAITGD
jgi:hypothetical protein